MKTRFTITGLLLFVALQMVYAQNFITAWTDQNSGANTGFMNRIATDGFHNVINTTSYSGGIIVGGQSFNSNGSLASLIIKRDDNGSLLWVRNLTSGGTALIGGIYIDQQSNIYVCGMFGDSISATTLNCHPHPISAGAGIQAFVVKYNPAGVVLWSNSFRCSSSGASGNADLYRITGNGTDRVVISAPFMPLAGVQNIGGSLLDPSTGRLAIAVSDDNGNWQVGKVISGVLNSYTNISLSQSTTSDVYVAGILNGSMDLGPAGVLSSQPGNSNDFIFKMDDSGNYEWAHLINSGSWWRPQVFAYQQEVYMAGSFGGSVTLGSTTLTCPFFSTYLCKLDQAGNFIWAKKYGDEQSNFYSGSISNNGIYLTGFTTDAFAANVFNGYTLTYANTLPSGVTTNALSYIIKTDLNGNTLQGACYGFTFATLNTMDLAQSGSKVYLTGNASNGAIFGGHTINPQLINGANYVAVYTDSANLITGNSFYDLNSNGLHDTGEPACAANLQLTSATLNSTNHINGEYLIGTGAGSFTTQLITPPLYYNVNPAGYTSVFPTLSSLVDSNRNFAFQPVPGQSDLITDLVTGAFRPGFDGIAWVSVKNIGTTTESGNIDLGLIHPNLTINYTLPAGSSISGNSTVLPYVLQPTEEILYSVYYTLDPQAQVGSMVNCTASAINPVDLTPSDNVVNQQKPVTGSYDPNEKVVLPAGDVSPDFVSNGEFLEYTIYFQNTGNDTAFTVLIKDTLDMMLDMGSFQQVSASHTVVTNTYDNVLWFRFNHILLPDSNTNEPMSHGYVKYRIKLKSTAGIGTLIQNRAFIYFDFNQPILTNTTHTLVDFPLNVSALSVAETGPEIYPNPSSGEDISVKYDYPLTGYVLKDAFGRVVRDNKQDAAKTLIIHTVDLPAGVYFLFAECAGGPLKPEKLIIR